MPGKRRERYPILQIDLGQPLAPVTIPEDAGGVAFVIRLNDRPVAFFMEEHPAGARIEAVALASKIMDHASKQILTEKLYADLRGKLDASRFPALDIAICTHDRPEDLKRCLQSLFATCHIVPNGPIRILVIDNAPSDDRTEELVRRFPCVQYVRESKPGLDFARNRALSESTGELLAFLDDDVIVDRCWLEGLREAWAANPDAGAFTGPILPMELETRAQIVFEQMGGFGKNFERVRFGAKLPESPTYPCGAGIFGAGANMVFSRRALDRLGGFDDALDTGTPLPGGGDLDMFYRIVRAGYPLVREPNLVVYHRHRREYRQLRRQMWTWGLGTMAYLVKSWRLDPTERPSIRRWALWWLCYQLSKILTPGLRRNGGRWPVDMVIAELLGAVVGICGQYDRSVARIARLRRKFV
jgi:GT2 family glycosyltransferase